MNVKYFVGSLSFNVNDSSLADHFAKYGRVTSSRVIIDKMTGKSKGFGFIEIENPVDNLTSIYNVEIDGRTTFMDEARPSERRNNNSKAGGFLRDLNDVVEKIDIGVALINNEIKVVELFEDGTYKYTDDWKNKYNLIHTFNSDSIRLKESIQEFEDIINKKSIKESEIQHFFESHPNFILNEDYKKAHSKIILQKENSDITIPDFILEPHNSNELCDLLELKLPNIQLYTQKKNRQRYSSAVFEAFAQLREYSSFFEDANNRKKISNRYGLNIYRPNMIVIIGRSKDIEPVLVKRVQSDIPGLHLITYDSILEKMKRKFK